MINLAEEEINTTVNETENNDKTEKNDSDDIKIALDIFADMLNRESRYYPKSWR